MMVQINLLFQCYELFLFQGLPQNYIIAEIVETTLGFPIKLWFQVVSRQVAG